MENTDIDKVLEAADILYTLNEKYGKPHGDNPIGIVYAAYSCVKRRVENQKKLKENLRNLQSKV